MTDRQPGRVLLLDDEPMVVESLKMLLQMETDYSVDACTRHEDALERLSAGGFHAVVSDFLMPGMDGIVFLAIARERQPMASRILLTGYADKGHAIRSINEVGLYHYVEKPWDNDALLMVIRNAVERSRLLAELDERVKKLERTDASLAELRSRLWRELV